MDKISIIIVLYQSSEYVGTCLEAIQRSSARKSIDFEWIIVDNNSHDRDVREVSKVCPEAKIIRNGKNQGYAAAINKGIRISSGKCLLLLNPDVVVKENAI